MKKKCKHVDITDINFIEKALYDCLRHKSQKQLEKKDWQSLIKECKSIHGIALLLHDEICNRNLKLEPTRLVEIRDKSNGKQRKLTIEHIKQQLYDYVAVHGLEELYCRYGYYQISVRKHGSPLMAVRYVQGWMNDKEIKFVVQMDIRKCYPSITHERMVDWLKRHVRNDNLLWLVDSPLGTSNNGLPIGSRLSIELCALYLSDVYHHIERNYYYTRRGKRVHVFKHCIFYLDDVFLFGSNARKMFNAVNDLIKVYDSIGLEIKPDWKIICLKSNRDDTHIDMLGYKVYHNRITMRRRDYIKTKRALWRFKKHQNNLHYAQGYIAMYGLFLKHTDSIKFRRKYKADKYYETARKVVSDYARSEFF